MANNIFECLNNSSISTRYVTKFFGVSDGQVYHRETMDILGNDIKYFSVNFIKIIDNVIIENNMYLFSKEQQKFFEKYATEADGILSNISQQFDEFLGSYLGG